MPKRKNYIEGELSDKKKRLKREMDKYKYRYHGEKIKQLTIDQVNNSKPLNNKKKK